MIEMKDPAIKTKPRRHQQMIYDAHRDDEVHALFLEMGLGKTKIVLDVASHQFLKGDIDALLVLAPKSVYKNWLSQEIPPHLGAPYIGMAFKTGMMDKTAGKLKLLYMLDETEWRGRLRIVCMSYDSMITDDGYQFAINFVTMFRTMMVLDESTAIKNAGTRRAKIAKKIGARAAMRWICTGTPVAQSPFSIHSQIEFLYPDFWANEGMRSTESFRTQFGVFELRSVGGGKKVNQVVGYKRLERLNAIIAPISSRLLKEDSDVELPPKIYTTRTFELSDKQRRVYDDLCASFIAELDNGMILEAPLAITRLMRLQQITSGFVGAEGMEVAPQLSLLSLSASDYESQIEAIKAAASAVPISAATVTRAVIDIVEPAENPRLQLLLEILDQCFHKAIIWCRFTRDVEIICASLGSRAVRYDGKVKSVEREWALEEFRSLSGPQFFVANVHAISMGVTLTIAKTAIYYSNSHSVEKRLQSEDRCHRIGQDVGVQIIDLVAEETVDVKLIDGLVSRFDIAAQVMGDKWRGWISSGEAEE